MTSSEETPTSSQAPIEAQKEALLGVSCDTAALPPAPRHRLAAANSLATAMALSLSAGYLDGFTFIGHGRTFASAMTGNMVLLGINLVQSGPRALAYLYPLLAFIFGVIVANLLGQDSVRRYLPASPHLMTLSLEIVVLAIVAFLPGGLDDHVLVAVVTVGTAMQNTSFRNIGTRPYNSIIMTGNLQTFSNSLVGLWHGAAFEQVRNLGSVLTSFVGGAALGAALTPKFGNHATLAPAALLVMVAIALTLSSDDRAAPSS